MRSYEAVLIFPPEATTEVRKDQFKAIDDLVAKFKGTIVQKNDWGKKPVGYPLKKFHEGHFLIVEFQMDPAVIPEFTKNLLLQDSILKFMITQKHTLRQSPKAARKAEAKASRAPAPAAAVKTAVS